jgi:hypothetical protein
VVEVMLRRVGLAVAAAVLALLPLAAPVGAADAVTFGTPTATPTFGTGIAFDQPVTATVKAKYVDILIDRPGLLGPEVHSIPTTGDISSTKLEYSLLEQDEHIYPNTTFTAHWRVTDTAGNVYNGPKTTVTYADTRFHWQTATGKLVTVHWYQGTDSFGQRALSIADAGVAKAEDLFGVTETEPVDFYVYADLQAFYDALGPGTRENVGGEALPEIRTLFALITPDQIDQSWVGTVIPHELTHLVFDTATRNPYHDPPHWLNEGLAVYLSQGFGTDDRTLVKNAVNAGTLIPLQGLIGQFPTQGDKFALGYAEAVSAVDYMVRTYGREAVQKLVKTYGTGVSDDQAFTAAFGVDTTAFGKAWLADVGAREPAEQGPLPDPTGPLPSGWSASPAIAAVPSAAASASAASSASAAPGSSSSGAPLPTLAAPSSVAGSPAASAGGSAAGVGAGSSPAAPSAAAPSPTPGLIAQVPASTTAPNTGLAWIFGLIAVLLAAAGIGMLAFRGRFAEPR